MVKIKLMWLGFYFYFWFIFLMINVFIGNIDIYLESEKIKLIKVFFKKRLINLWKCVLVEIFLIILCEVF